MSNYRVLDDHKNKYDADVVADLLPVENGFTVIFEADDISSYRTSATVTIDSAFSNPANQKVTSPTGNGKWICFKGAITGGVSCYTDISFVNNSDFEIQITNIDYSVPSGYSSPSISEPSLTIPPNSNAITRISGSTIVALNSATISLDSFDLYRV